MRLGGKVAFISGGARGMGAAEARLFAREGAKVAIGDIREDEGRLVETEINESGGEALFAPLDVTNEEAWDRAIQSTVDRFGKLDILVNNAGVALFSVKDAATVEEWDLAMNVNAKGVFLGTRVAIPYMRRTGGGSIVNISSVSGLVAQEFIHPGYNASKAAVRLLTKVTAVQYASEGIRANSVHPGHIMTPMSEPEWGDPDLYRTALETTPLGRYGEPDDVSYGVLFLASDESSYMTGSELVIDGGMTAQ